MIRQSNDGNGTEFSHWLRKQEKDLPSKNAPDCFTFNNLDYIDLCYRGKNAGKWMVIEEKRHGYDLRFAQEQAFKKLESVCFIDKSFLGFHLIQFENTNPDDGLIWIDGDEVTREDFIKFLRFEQPKRKYASFFPDTIDQRAAILANTIKGRPPGSHQKITFLPITQLKLQEVV